MTYTDTSKTWALAINGTNRIALLEKTSLRGQDSEGSAVDTLSFTLTDQAGVLGLSPMQTVKLTADGATVFGGYIQEIETVPSPGLHYPTYKVTAVSWHDLLRRAETTPISFVGATAKSILQAIFTAAGLSGFDVTTYVVTGPTLDSFAVSLTNVADALDLLALSAGGEDAATGYVWRITGDAEIVFQPETDEAAPFAVADFGNSTYLSAGTIYPIDRESGKLSTAQGEFFNRVVFDLGMKAGAETTDTFSGDASAYIFPTTKAPIEDVINVFVGGVAKRHGTKGYDSIGVNGVECLIDYAGGALWFAPGSPPAAGTDNVTITYRQLERMEYVYTSAGGYALAGNRWITKRVRHTGITTEEQAELIATALLNTYATAWPKAMSFTVRRLGLQAGQRIAVTMPAAMGMSGTYTIRDIDYAFDPREFTLVTNVTAGTRTMRFSDFLTRTAPQQQPALEQPVMPRTNKEVGIQRVGDRIEMLTPGTTFDWP